MGVGRAGVRGGLGAGQGRGSRRQAAGCRGPPAPGHGAQVSEMLSCPWEPRGPKAALRDEQGDVCPAWVGAGLELREPEVSPVTLLALAPCPTEEETEQVRLCKAVFPSSLCMSAAQLAPRACFLPSSPLC